MLYSHRSTVPACHGDLRGGLRWRSPAAETVLLIVPLFHACGWGIPYSAAMCGASLVFPGVAMDGASLCELLQPALPLSMGVPTVWLNFSSIPMWPTWPRPPRLKVLIGGSAAPRALIERLQKDWASRSSTCGA